MKFVKINYILSNDIQPIWFSIDYISFNHLFNIQDIQYCSHLNFLFNYSFLINKQSKKIIGYKLFLHSYIKKYFNSTTRHGLKLTSTNAFFYSYLSLFTYIYNYNTLSNRLSYNYTTTFIYNLDNYKWLRNSFTLWGWTISWLNFIFKSSISQRSHRAGHSKKAPIIVLKYVTPIKRPLVVYYFYKNFIKINHYRSFSSRASNILFDTFLNYKKSKLFLMKIGIYQKHIQKTLKS